MLWALAIASPAAASIVIACLVGIRFIPDLSFLISMCRGTPCTLPHVVPAEECDDHVTEEWHRVRVCNSGAMLRDPAHDRSERGAADDRHDQQRAAELYQRAQPFEAERKDGGKHDGHE